MRKPSVHLFLEQIKNMILVLIVTKQNVFVIEQKAVWLKGRSLKECKNDINVTNWAVKLQHKKSPQASQQEAIKK